MLRKSPRIALTAILALVGATLITAACAKSEAPTGPSPAAVASGKQLYEANCMSCHGANGAGGNKIGDSTAADVRWSALGPMYDNDLGLVRRAIRDGKNEDGEPLDSEMPQWKDRLSVTQTDEIIAYLQTLK